MSRRFKEIQKYQRQHKRAQGRPVANKHKVPATTWKGWSNIAKKVFNRLYYEMRPRRQHLFLHNRAAPLPVAHWEITRYNSAWIAANAANGAGKLVVLKTKRKRRKR